MFLNHSNYSKSSKRKGRKGKLKTKPQFKIFTFFTFLPKLVANNNDNKGDDDAQSHFALFFPVPFLLGLDIGAQEMTQ